MDNMKSFNIKFQFVLLTIIIITSCSTNKPDNNNFISRLHTPSDSIDWYHVLGATTLDKHFEDFNSIDWETEFWKEVESDNFNFPDIEVMDTLNNLFLSVSTFPDNNSFQFIICVGNHTTKHQVGYLKSYLLESNDPYKVKKFMELFFNQKYDKLFKEVEKFYNLFEVEDVYNNYPVSSNNKE